MLLITVFIMQSVISKEVQFVSDPLTLLALCSTISPFSITGVFTRHRFQLKIDTFLCVLAVHLHDSAIEEV